MLLGIRTLFRHQVVITREESIKTYQPLPPTYNRSASYLWMKMKNMFQYHCKKRCTNALCLNISREFICDRVLRCLHFGGDIDTTQTVPQMINQYFRLENRNYRCQVCNYQMEYSNILVSCPLIICICFNGTNVLCEFEKVAEINNEIYDFVSAIYIMGNHFRTRFSINNIAYEYDGMINNGVFKQIDTMNPFSGTIYNADRSVFMKAMSVYYVKREVSNASINIPNISSSHFNEAG